MKKVTLKLARKHPHRQMRLGSHMVESIPRAFNLSDEEYALLSTDGPKHWIMEVDASAAVAKEPTKKAMTPLERMQVELKELGVDLSGTETLNQLENLMVENLNK